MSNRFSHLSTALIASALSVQASALEIDCASIIDETVSELRIGAASWWSEDVEKIAGMSAMAACFKVASAYCDHSGENRVEADSDPSDSAQGESPKDPSPGLSFRPLSGAGSKKPYERARGKKGGQ
mgnify:FL=1